MTTLAGRHKLGDSVAVRLYLLLRFGSAHLRQCWWTQNFKNRIVNQNAWGAFLGIWVLFAFSFILVIFYGLPLGKPKNCPLKKFFGTPLHTALSSEKSNNFILSWFPGQCILPWFFLLLYYEEGLWKRREKLQPFKIGRSMSPTTLLPNLV